MPITATTYEQLVLEDRESHWELWCGQLRRKPDVTTEHAGSIDVLDRMIQRQLDENLFRVRSHNGRLRRSNGSYFEADLCVIPITYYRRLRARPGSFEVYDDPVPFVAEAWSPSTGEYDVETKFPEYRLRRDQEIWRIHPYERTVTAWRLQPDGTYTEHVFTSGTVQLHALPDITIDIEKLWD